MPLTMSGFRAMVDGNATDGPSDAATFEGVIDEITALLRRPLPPEYVQFLRDHDGFEGFAGEIYIVLWKAEDLIHLNHAYGLAQYVPGIFLIGSNGGGEAYAFDSHDASMPVLRIPFICIDRGEAELVSTSSTDLSSASEPTLAADGITEAADLHFELGVFWNKLIHDIHRQWAD
ncbi:MAG: hypothetical protein JWL84_2267 [Rhodospirillales bacterium]|nr:hypothetical protein [Rhodospirillales bacterium]